MLAEPACGAPPTSASAPNAMADVRTSSLRRRAARGQTLRGACLQLTMIGSAVSDVGASSFSTFSGSA
jgi:hypothetical protein